MKRYFFVPLLLLWSLAALAAGTQYIMSVDGLACPFCAFGIEKRLNTIEGVRDTAVDLEQGIVVVSMTEGSILSEEVAREKVKDAGFTLRAFSSHIGCRSIRLIRQPDRLFPE